jgi:hypothetical protein
MKVKLRSSTAIAEPAGRSSPASISSKWRSETPADSTPTAVPSPSRIG